MSELERTSLIALESNQEHMRSNATSNHKTKKEYYVVKDHHYTQKPLFSHRWHIILIMLQICFHDR